MIAVIWPLLVIMAIGIIGCAIVAYCVYQGYGDNNNLQSWQTPWQHYAEFAAGVVCVILLLVGVLGVPIIILDRKSCYDTAHQMNREWRYELLTACLVRIDDGTYIDIDSFRANHVEGG